MNELKQSHITVTLNGGIDVWGVEFVQWLEKELDAQPRFVRVGKSVTDELIHIHINMNPVIWIGDERGEA